MHAIRLREPWEVETLPAATRYRRWFNKPTGLDAGTQVHLVIEQLDPAARIALNDEPLAKSSTDNPHCWPITPLLQLRNSIAIEIDRDCLPQQRPFGEVRLEIEVGQEPH